LRTLIVAAPQQRGSAGLFRLRRPMMRNLETVAFGAAALVAQALVVAAILVA
jgi:hypothetical protein